ncbi:ABC transporter transmembrane domain-containing protein [Kushneria sp. Sum13]|uniref:ABC transporter transmembrane domain-containing protein n=1 Tax=Kushneria sp. Sum13 TaxID=3459196 RepID=UPI0040459027
MKPITGSQGVIALIVLESVLWRGSGWFGSRVIVSTCAELRVDLFHYLTGQSMRYFNRQSTGALGARISATGASTNSILSTLTWNVTPPCVDFLGVLAMASGSDNRRRYGGECPDISYFAWFA